MPEHTKTGTCERCAIEAAAFDWTQPNTERRQAEHEARLTAEHEAAVQYCGLCQEHGHTYPAGYPSTVAFAR